MIISWGEISDFHLAGRTLALKLKLLRKTLAIMKQEGVTDVFFAGDTLDVQQVGDSYATVGTVHYEFSKVLRESGMLCHIAGGES